jgi:hypothetical protein
VTSREEEVAVAVEGIEEENELDQRAGEEVRWYW